MRPISASNLTMPLLILSRSPKKAKIKTGHDRLEELQSYDAADRKKRGDDASAQLKIDRRNNAS